MQKNDELFEVSDIDQQEKKVIVEKFDRLLESMEENNKNHKEQAAFQQLKNWFSLTKFAINYNIFLIISHLYFLEILFFFKISSKL